MDIIASLADPEILLSSLPVFLSHIFIVPGRSSDLEIIYVPSGLNLTEPTPLLSANKVLISCPVATSHIMIVPFSKEHETISFPSGLKATDATLPRMSCFLGCFLR